MALSQHARRLRDGILAAIRSAFPVEAVPTVVPHDGAADLDFVKKYAIVAPAVILTILGGVCKPTGATLFDELQVGLYVITKGDDQTRRTAEALVIREHLQRLMFAPATDVYADGRHKVPHEIDSKNLFDGKVDDMGVTIWVLAWKHGLEIPPLVADEDLDVFRRFWVELFNPGEVEVAVETGNALTEQMIEPEQDA